MGIQLSIDDAELTDATLTFAEPGTVKYCSVLVWQTITFQVIQTSSCIWLSQIAIIKIYPMN